MEQTQIFFEDLDEGDEIPALVKSPSRAQLFMYSAITWNVHRIHYDRDFAKLEEHPDVLVHGPLQGALLGNFMTDWIGAEGELKKISWSNRGRSFPEEPYVMKGIIRGKRSQDGANLVDCEIWGENKEGERLAIGSATVALPSRG